MTLAIRITSLLFPMYHHTDLSQRCKYPINITRSVPFPWALMDIVPYRMYLCTILVCRMILKWDRSVNCVCDTQTHLLIWLVPPVILMTCLKGYSIMTYDRGTFPPFTYLPLEGIYLSTILFAKTAYKTSLIANTFNTLPFCLPFCNSHSYT